MLIVYVEGSKIDLVAIKCEGCSSGVEDGKVSRCGGTMIISVSDNGVNR